MPRRIQILAGVTLLLGSHGLALGAGKESGSAAAFAVASVRFEQNATDGDAEVVFEVKGGKEGLARLTVISPDGRTVIDFTALNHRLPATASFLQPRAGTRDVGAQNLKITWTPVKNLAAYIIRIKRRTLGVNLTAKLPGAATTFAVPEGFLRPGTEYQLAIGTVSNEGNISFIETTFTIAGRE